MTLTNRNWPRDELPMSPAEVVRRWARPILKSAVSASLAGLVVAPSFVFSCLLTCQTGAIAASGEVLNFDKMFLVPGEQTRKERILIFPPESQGEIIIFRLGGGGKVLHGAAKGKIVVPAGSVVKFIPTHRFYLNPTMIDELAPDSIDILELTASSLDDSEDGLCDRALTHIGHLKGLIGLNLDRSDATDKGVAYAAQCPNLQQLNAYSTTIRGPCLRSLATLRHLRNLRLARNGIGDDNLRYLGAIPTLETLDLIGCDISDQGMKNLSGCTNLQSLALGDNPKITDASVKVISGFKKVLYLGLGNTSISNQGVMQLKCPRLSRLQLPSREVAPAQMTTFSRLFRGVRVSLPAGRVKKVDEDTGLLFGPMH